MFKLKEFTVFCIVNMIIIGFSFAQQTSTNTVTQEKEFVNPLPKDKFVFLEIKEEINTNAKYPPPIKYEFNPPSYYEKGILYIINKEDIPDSDTFLIIFHYTSRLPSFIPIVYKISDLPFKIELPSYSSYWGIKEKDWFEKVLLIKKVNFNGDINLEYGQKDGIEKITLAGEKIWMKKLKKKIWSPTMEYPNKILHKFHNFRVALQITNHSILDKSGNVNIDKFKEKYKWDSQRKEFIHIKEEENQP